MRALVTYVPAYSEGISGDLTNPRISGMVGALRYSPSFSSLTQSHGDWDRS